MHRPTRSGPALSLAALFTLGACSKTAAPGSPAAPGAPSGSPDASGPVAMALEGAEGTATGPREAAQWAAASDGDPEELMRLADLVKCDGLHEGSTARGGVYRLTALRAAQYCDDFSELPWLVEVATTGTDGDAKVALDAVVAQAARKRRPVDPEDAEELHDGCASLLALARMPDAPKARRAPAVSALRMLVDYGCVMREEIPTDVDAK